MSMSVITQKWPIYSYVCIKTKYHCILFFSLCFFSLNMTYTRHKKNPYMQYIYV